MTEINSPPTKKPQRSNKPLVNTKKLLHHCQERIFDDKDTEIKEVRGVAEAWMKLYMLENKFKVQDDDSGLSELQNRLHSEVPNG